MVQASGILPSTTRGTKNDCIALPFDKFRDLRSSRELNRSPYLRTRVIFKVHRLGLISLGYPSGNNFENIQKHLLDLASRVSSLRTGVTSKVDHLGLTSSGYPSGTYFKDIQKLLMLVSRVSSLRIGVTFKVDCLGLTSSGYPSGTNF